MSKISMTANSLVKPFRFMRVKTVARFYVFFLTALMASACAKDFKTKVSGNLQQLSPLQTVAILPFANSDKGQRETAELLRQNFFANLRDSTFQLMERYRVDALLAQYHGLSDPNKFSRINPMEFGEILGVDAVVLGRLEKVERSYWIIHSSIELGIGVQMIDTRTGEVLWEAEQTETDFEGIAKIPTGITSTIIAPIHFVTNKLNLQNLASNMVSKLTAILKTPGSETSDDSDESGDNEAPVIARAAAQDMNELQEVQKIQSQWQTASLDTAGDTNRQSPGVVSPTVMKTANLDTGALQKPNPTPINAGATLSRPPTKITDSEKMPRTPIVNVASQSRPGKENSYRKESLQAVRSVSRKPRRPAGLDVLTTEKVASLTSVRASEKLSTNRSVRSVSLNAPDHFSESVPVIPARLDRPASVSQKVQTIADQPWPLPPQTEKHLETTFQSEQKNSAVLHNTSGRLQDARVRGKSDRIVG